MQIAELEKEQGSLATAAAQREEELSALRDQLESAQIQLAGAQASDIEPQGTLWRPEMCCEGFKAIGPNCQGLLWAQFLKPSASVSYTKKSMWAGVVPQWAERLSGVHEAMSAASRPSHLSLLAHACDSLSQEIDTRRSRSSCYPQPLILTLRPA